MDSARADQPGTLSLETVRALIGETIRPGHFFAGPDLTLAWQPPAQEEISWEIFRGRLLDPAHTRQTRQFTSWNVYQLDGKARSAEPLLAVKLDERSGQIHVVRAILCHVWEGFDAGDNVIQSRQRTKWVRELVGTISLGALSDEEELHGELRELLGAAVRGTSRLPLNSVEAPLPAFSLGQLAYLPAPAKDVARDQPLRSWHQLLEVVPIPLESLLRSITPDQGTLAAGQYAAKSPAHTFLEEFPRLLRRLFTHVSLSPYTQFVDTTMAFVKALADMGRMTSGHEADFSGWLLRQLGRHLTAYDLITFHYRGANYPDALLLDAALKRYVQLIENHAELFQGSGNPHEAGCRRLRRRALRQACLARRYYVGQPVPDAPTSPGESARVLPPPHVTVPEEQLVNVLRRRKQLYSGEPLAALLTSKARTILRESILDLADQREWRELGIGVFIDRPFGWGKAVGEPDLTPLLAHEAFSPSIARRRWHELDRLAQELNLEKTNGESWRPIEDLTVTGLPAAQVAEPDRPIVSLADARRVADDFVILRTLQQGLEELSQAVDFAPLHAQMPFPGVREKLLVVRLSTAGKDSVLAWFDGHLRKRVEMVTDVSQGFVIRAGREMPAAGLRVVRGWDENGEMREVDIRLRAARSRALHSVPAQKQVSQ